MRSRTSIVAASVIIGAATGIAAWGSASGEPRTTDRSEQVVIAHGKDRFPSQTAQDWVTYADHVVVATAVNARETSPADEEVARGEGLIGRQVSLRVDEVLWSSDQAERPAPETWKRASMGWTFKNGSVSNRTKIALENRPRVEVGHRYIMALAWAPAKCATGDKPESAHWVGLGEGSLLPFDHGIIGEGESEGRTQNAAPTERLTGGVGGMSVEDAVAGKGADALKHKLQAVSPFSKKLQPTSSAGSACS